MTTLLPRIAATLLLWVAAASSASAATPEPFLLKDSDRVLLIGDTLLERENTFGHIETRFRLEFPQQRFSVRNLAFSADTPAGISRASFDPAAKGIDHLREQLDLVKPTVAVLGYGMAASLEEITYRRNDPGLNPDPTRYGTEHTAARFKTELAQLMDLITEASPEKKVRFILLSPLAHEDLRPSRPALPDPREHNELLTAYSAAIEDLARERGARFVKAEWQKSAGLTLSPATDNGIHLTSQGYRALAEGIAVQLGWKPRPTALAAEDTQSAAVRQSILRKHELFFHRWRPANHTYLLGFRKREQGNNAVELPKFDPLVEKAEADTFALASGQRKAPPAPLRPPATLLPLPSQPAPDFALDADLEIQLFAENPLLEKPVQMNWDAQGRLWVASSNTYPQVNPEDLAAAMAGDAAKPGPSTGNDKILILEDADRDGRAEKSTIFADGLLIPSAVAPDNRGGCYVGASTELRHLSKPGPDGRATTERVILSGFGTEDTHHTIHTLHWGVDGRLYFHQSIYIHSHLETPWGVLRANSGAVLALDTESERVELCSQGLVNSWGQQEDRFGQMFLTDGAGGKGINWGFPGSAFTTTEGARRIVDSVSPGSYPKFCSLELIQSPAFPEAWQGSAITCDFRAHRIVRFSFTDLTTAEKPLSGYVTKDQPDVVRTSDMAFRPIDVRLGPDGALYVADWSNPVINHGEVDFRDPRRDKHHGRIWRITHKGSKPAQWQSLAGKSTEELTALLLSNNRWEQEQTRQMLRLRPELEVRNTLSSWAAKQPQENRAAAGREVLWVLSGKSDLSAGGLLTPDNDPHSIVAGIRELSRRLPLDSSLWNSEAARKLPELLSHASPRVRLEAVRAMARMPSAASAEQVLAKLPADNSDAFLDYATWLSVNQLARPWVAAVLDGSWKTEGREPQLAYALNSIDPVIASPVINHLLKGRAIAKDGEGPWIELAGKGGSPAELTKLFKAVIERQLDPQPRTRALAALIAATRERNTRPEGSLTPAAQLLDDKDPTTRAAGARLAGLWKLNATAQRLGELATTQNPQVQPAAFEGLRSLGGKPALEVLEPMLAATNPTGLRLAALGALAQVRLPTALASFEKILASAKSVDEAAAVWRSLLQTDAAAPALEKDLPKNLTPTAYAGGLKAAREIGRKGGNLAKLLAPLAGELTKTATTTQQSVQSIIGMMKQGADPADGERVYRQSGCVQCHAIGGAGGKLGPDMSSLGASAPLDYIIESVIDPASKVKEGYHAFAFTLKDGTQMVGIPTRETATEQFIRPGPVPEIAVIKANIAKRENIGSLMPAGLVDALDGVPKRNLFAFLGELGKPGVFDASKGNVARVWWLHSKRDAAQQAADGGTPAYTLVDGRLPRALATPLAQVSGGGELFALARFETAAPTTKPLVLSGAKTAWLDGQPITLDEQGRSTAPIAAGAHRLVVQLDPKALPEVLKIQCDDARFIGD